MKTRLAILMFVGLCLTGSLWSQQPRPRIVDPEASRGPLKQAPQTPLPTAAPRARLPQHLEVPEDLLQAWASAPVWQRGLLEEGYTVYDPDRTLEDNFEDPSYHFTVLRASWRD